MLIETRKDYTVNLGNRNFAKGGFSISNDVPREQADKEKEWQVNKINEWIEVRIEEEKKRYAATFADFQEH